MNRKILEVKNSEHEWDCAIVLSSLLTTYCTSHKYCVVAFPPATTTTSGPPWKLNDEGDKTTIVATQKHDATTIITVGREEAHDAMTTASNESMATQHYQSNKDASHYLHSDTTTWGRSTTNKCI